MRRRTRTGAPAGCAGRRGPGDRVHHLFRGRQRDGTWARIATRLQTEGFAQGPQQAGRRAGEQVDERGAHP